MQQSPHPKRDLRLLAGAAGLSAGGDMIAVIVLALAVHDLTASGLAVSAYFATRMLPVVALAPFAGRLADRVESVTIMGFASLAQAVIATGLAFGTGELWLLLVLSSALSALSAISQPAEFALVPVLASGDELTRANGLMEAAHHVGYAGGPLVAAALTAVGDAQLALLVNAASFLAIAVAARLIRARRMAPATAAGDDATEAETAGGTALLLADPILRATLLPAVGALFFISACITAEVFYVKDVLGQADVWYALLMVCWMSALVIGAAFVAHRIPARHAATAALIALAFQGLGMGGQTIVLSLIPAVIGYLLGGLGHGVKNTLLRTLIQARVAASAHGRAFAAYNAARNAAEVVALAAGGLLVAAIGARLSLVVAGAGPLIGALLGLLFLKTRPRLATRPLPEGA